MWFLSSGVPRRKLPWWFLASSETWREALEISAPQLQGRHAAGQRKDRNDCHIRNMNHIHLPIDTESG